MASSSPTLRSLARSLKLSHTTVADALRGTGRVDPATVERVREAAREAGYQRNPLASTLMSELRRARTGTFQGALAAVNLHEPERKWAGDLFHRELLSGAAGRAAALGFKMEEFIVGRGDLTIPRLNTILRSRGIQGILLMPVRGVPDWSQLDWNHYTGVYTDFSIERPALDCVCFDHYRSTIAVLGRLAALGYRRPGLYLQRRQDERIQHRFSAAFYGFQKNLAGSGTLPPLIAPEFCREEFVSWFKHYQPDVVVSHCTEAIDWMESCGARLPETHGFVSLNLLYKTRPSAGLDQQPGKIGEHAAELLIAHLHCNQYGLPAWPTTMTIPGRWVDGPTLRHLPVTDASASLCEVGPKEASISGKN